MPTLFSQPIVYARPSYSLTTLHLQTTYFPSRKTLSGHIGAMTELPEFLRFYVYPQTGPWVFTS